MKAREKRLSKRSQSSLWYLEYASPILSVNGMLPLLPLYLFYTNMPPRVSVRQ